MAVTDLLHLFQSVKPQGSDATQVSKNEWNAPHYVGSYKVGVAPPMIAASDATDAEKAFALLSGGEIVSGSNDGTRLSAYSGRFILSSGTFTLDADWTIPAAYTDAIGQGKTTIIALNSHKIRNQNKSHVALGGFKVTGQGDQSAMPAALGAFDFFITADTEDHYFHDIWCTATKCDHFKYYLVDNIVMDTVTFERIYADSPDGMGLKIDGETNNPELKNVRYINFTVKSAGLGANRIVDGGGISWTCGFDFAEYSGLKITNMWATNCLVDGAWESGFHFETGPVKTRVKLSNCATISCGQKTGSAVGFGAFTLSGNIDLEDCSDTGSHHHIWLYGTGSAKLNFVNFVGRSSVSDGLVTGGTVAGDSLKFIGGGFYDSGVWGINGQGSLHGLLLQGFDVINPTGSGNIANWIDGDDVRVIGCEFTCSTAATTGIYVSDGDDMMFKGNRFKINGNPIYASASTVVRPVATDNDSRGSNLNIDLATNATNPRVANNIDKDGAWAWGDNVQ